MILVLDCSYINDLLKSAHCLWGRMIIIFNFICSSKNQTYRTVKQSMSNNLNRTARLNKLCGRPPQYAPPPVTLTFDLLTLKVVSESRVMWATSLPILVFLGLSVLDLGLMYMTDVRHQTASSLNAPPRGRGIRSTHSCHRVGVIFWKTFRGSQNLQNLNVCCITSALVLLLPYVNLPVTVRCYCLGLGRLTNQCRGQYYGPASTWTGRRRRQVGVLLLHKAYRILLCEGERQIRLRDVAWTN